MSRDKRQRLERAALIPDDDTCFLALDLSAEEWRQGLLQCVGFSSGVVSFCSLLGLSYYLTGEAFRRMLRGIADCVPAGSAIVFDYPDEEPHTEKAGERARKQALLADGAGETMLASYSYEAMEALLAEAGFLIYEHLTPGEITEHFFGAYNRISPGAPTTALDNVNCCLAVRR